MMKKLFVLLIKYMPTIQLVGMLVNNTLYKYDVNLEFDYIGDFLGNSIANITILYVCSYTFVMTPQYQFNLGQTDPLLSGRVNPNEDYFTAVNQEIERLNKIRTQLIPPTVATQPQVNVWEEIDKEIASLTNDQKQILAQDQTYAGIEQELQFLIQQELINSVKGKVANSARGKELLDMQLKNIKDKKAKIVEEANKEAELFKKFQIATQANPNLTYAEFIKNVNGK